ncbi:MAG: hypothetical protein JWO63_1727 [Frankiales bacterium]|nr:hypothetical protein [Frankiales bacterium]
MSNADSRLGPLSRIRIDFAPRHRQPSAAQIAVATVVAIAGSLAADAVIVRLGETLFPSTKGYAHFQFADYAKLTVIGVLVACLGWPVITRVSSAPRWVYSRLAVLVTLVLLLPDVWLLYQGQSPQAVSVLMVMHLAIAFATYFAVVLIARAGRAQE